jgi:hypothetical protein
VSIRCWLGAIALIWTVSSIVVAGDAAMHFYVMIVMMIIYWTVEIAVVMMICVPYVDMAMITMIT